MDLYLNNVVQDRPIISDEQVEVLKRVQFQTVKDGSEYLSKKNLYTANDKEFLSFFEKLTKLNSDTILEKLNLEPDWNNTDRLNNRLLIMKTFGKNIQIAPDFNEEKGGKTTRKNEKKKVMLKNKTLKKVKQASPLKNNSDVLDKNKLDLLHQIKFTLTKNLYTATDDEFERYIIKATKSNREKIFKNVESPWNDENRLRIRLSLIERFKVSISSAQEKGLTL